MAHVTSKSCKIFEQNNERYEKKWHNKRSQVLFCCCCCKVAVTRDWLKQSGRNIDDNEERKCLLLIYLASCQVLLCFLVIDGTFIGALSGTFVTLSLDCIYDLIRERWLNRVTFLWIRQDTFIVIYDILLISSVKWSETLDHVIVLCVNE